MRKTSKRQQLAEQRQTELERDTEQSKQNHAEHLLHRAIREANEEE